MSQWRHSSSGERTNQTESGRGSWDLFILQETDAANSRVSIRGVEVGGWTDAGGVKEGRMDGG